MGDPVARKGDRIVGLDTHIVMVPSPGGPVPTLMPMAFDGPLSGDLSATVLIDGKPVALVGSTADNTPQHIPVGGPFQSPPSNRAKVSRGSSTTVVDGRGVARSNDPATCCNDPSDQDTGQVVVSGCTVLAG